MKSRGINKGHRLKASTGVRPSASGDLLLPAEETQKPA